jgi:predicted Zn-ribbon and HTH transcriptional regulator
MSLKRQVPRRPRTPQRCRECGTILDPEDIQLHSALCLDCRCDAADRAYDLAHEDPRWSDQPW